MALRWFWAVAGFFAAEMDLGAETIISALVREGDSLPGQIAGETYTVSDLAEACSWSDGKVYFWAKGQSSIALAGVREGIWSYSGGTFTAEILEGNGVPNNAAALKIGKFDANNNAGVIKNYTINPSGALEVSVRLRAGGVNANSDRGVIYHKDGVNTSLWRSANANSVLRTGVSLLPNGAAFSDTLTPQQIGDVEQDSIFSSQAINGLPAPFLLASAPAAVIGEAGAAYTQVLGIAQSEDGSATYTALVTANAQSTARVGLSNGAVYAFPLAAGTAVEGTGGSLQLGRAVIVLPVPGGGAWWLIGSVQANGGADLNFELPFIFGNNTLTSLFPGGVLAALFGEDGLTRQFYSLGEGSNGDIAMLADFETDAGDNRIALLHRTAAGAYRLVAEEGRILKVGGVVHAVTRLDSTKQPLATDGRLYFSAVLDGNTDTILFARQTTAAPVVHLNGRDRRTTRRVRLQLSGTATDDGSIRQVNYKVNRSGERVAAGTDSWQFGTRLKKNRNRITIRAIDGDGGSSAPVTVTIRRRSR